MSRRIILLINGVHMGLGHDGLGLIARKFKINVEKLEDGEMVMFLNRAQDKLKIIGKQGRVIGYLRMPKKQRIMLEAIQFIPQAFASDGSLDYDSALKLALEKLLATQKKHVSPLRAYRAAQLAGV